VTAPERWLPVPGYEGLYEISSYGQVWSAPRATTRGGLLKLVNGTAGYKWVTLTRNGVQERFQVHRLVMRAFVGACPEGLEVRHLDGDPANNRWAPGGEEETRAAGGNLIYGTHSANMRDKKEHGTEWQSNVTHCPKNHEYTPENTRILKSGSRACLTCEREKARAWHEAHAVFADPLITCPCGQVFERPPNQGRRKYCSEECVATARREARHARKAA
jgi:hypothetical protein